MITRWLCNIRDCLFRRLIWRIPIVYICYIYLADGPTHSIYRNESNLFFVFIFAIMYVISWHVLCACGTQLEVHKYKVISHISFSTTRTSCATLCWLKMSVRDAACFFVNFFIKNVITFQPVKTNLAIINTFKFVPESALVHANCFLPCRCSRTECFPHWHIITSWRVSCNHISVCV